MELLGVLVVSAVEQARHSATDILGSLALQNHWIRFAFKPDCLLRYIQCFVPY